MSQSRFVLDETFRDFEVGPFPSDYTPLGEYHYRPPRGFRGRWYEPTNRGWRLGSHWVVLEEDGSHVMEQATNTGYTSLLVSGETDWQDYTLRVVMKPLLPRGQAGVLFRYVHGRAYYSFVLEGGTKAKLIRTHHEETTILAEREFVYDCDTKYNIVVQVTGRDLAVSIDGAEILAAVDDSFAAGRIGLLAQVPAGYYHIVVEMTPDIHTRFVHHKDRRERERAEAAATYPQPQLWRTINLRGWGAGRHVRFGDLTGDGRPDMVFAQNVMHHGIDLYSTITCLTAFTLDGKVLWQFGEPRTHEAAGLTTSDLAFQIYDIDGDGCNEVLLTKNWRLFILDGRTGRVKKSVPLPLAPPLTQETCFKWPESDFHRINGDAIIIANVSGKDRPSDILIKNRYNFIWAWDCDLNPLWRVHCYTGHFPQPYDFNGDGRDEIMACWTLISADGKIEWDLSREHGFKDHVDEIAIGHFNPRMPDVQIGLVAGDEGFLIVSPEGAVLYQDKLGHAQRVTAAKFRADLPGVQFFVVTYWDRAGIISFHDATGARLFSFEPPSTGNILNPVNWTGEGVELALLSGSYEHGGMIDGYGRRVVTFPADGHPELAAEVLDVTGDERDEILLWDMKRMYIYTQDRPAGVAPLYRPRRYPSYNASNYRAEISLPR